MTTRSDTSARPGRALIGWMTPPDAGSLLAGPPPGVAGGAPEEEAWRAARAERARATVAARADGVDQSGAVLDLPGLGGGGDAGGDAGSLAAHLAALRDEPLLAGLFQSGWEPRLVDLSRVIAVQPTVHTDARAERFEAVDGRGLAGLAAITLPAPDPGGVSVQFDPVRNAWIFTGRTPNLRVLSTFQGPAAPGTVGAGFVVGVAPSMVQVAGVQGRYLLRDGYHRAYELLRRGITHVPALVREHASVEEAELPSPMLPQAAVLGGRPPMLPDYLDDTVAVDTELPVVQRTIVIQALELSPIV